MQEQIKEINRTKERVQKYTYRNRRQISDKLAKAINRDSVIRTVFSTNGHPNAGEKNEPKHKSYTLNKIWTENGLRIPNYNLLEDNNNLRR